MRKLTLTLQEAIQISKTLGNNQRMEILRFLTGGPKNVNEIAEHLGLPFTTVAANVKKLEEAGLIKTQMVPGRGTQKVCSKLYDRIIIDLEERQQVSDTVFTIELGVGEYVNCDIEPTCGLLSDEGIIGMLDDIRTFYELERKKAQLLWFHSGYVEYHFPNRIPYNTVVDELSFSVELCSEAPYHNDVWPSDITCWINGVELGDWTCPGDFGGKRGFLTPSWWETHNTQFGLLKYWKINQEGSFVDGVKISSVTIDDLKLQQLPYIALRIGIKKDAKNVGGINLFGSKFGNYEQGIIMKIKYIE